MNLREIKNLSTILEGIYNEPGNGVLIDYLWDRIADENQDFKVPQINEAFIMTIQYLLERNMIRMAGIYDDKNKQEVHWEGTTKDFIILLQDFLAKASPKKLYQWSGQVFFLFKYQFIDWCIPYPVNWKSYGIDW